MSKDRSRSPVQGSGYKRVITNKVSKMEGMMEQSGWSQGRARDVTLALLYSSM